MDEETFKPELAAKLKRLRETRDLSVAEVAAACGIAQERIAQYESGECLPALGELMSLAKALDVSMGHFFLSEISAERVEVVRVQDRWTVKPETSAAATLNYSYQALSYRMTGKAMSPFYVEIPPSESTKIEPSAHDGEEFIFILDGEATVRIGDDTHELARGDAMYYDSRIPHQIRALGAQPLKMLVCLVNVHRLESDTNPMARAF